MKKINLLAGMILAVTFFAPSFSSAQSTADLQSQLQTLLQQVAALRAQLKTAQDSQAYCHNFQQNLRVGDQGDEVRILQGDLQKEGFSISQDEINNGQYGEGTAAAVSGFQEKYSGDILAPNGLKYGTGFTGRGTRNKLNKLYGCGETPPPPPVSAPTISVIYPQTGNNLDNSGGKSSGLIANITWTTSNFGNLNVELDLVGSNGNIVKNIANNIPNTGSYPWAYDPSIPNGTYRILAGSQDKGPSAQSYGGYFTLSGNNSGAGSPVISGVSGPTTLQTGQQGTWTVTASDPANGTLSYSVVWGDEAPNCAGGISCPTNTGAYQLPQQTATFTHTYNTAGTYSPKFTVTNASGLNAQTSLSVIVGAVATTPTFSVMVSPNTPAGSVLAGTQNLGLLQFSVTGSQSEAIRITDMTITEDNISPGAPAQFSNLSLSNLDTGVVLGYFGALSGAPPTFSAVAHFISPIVVPVNGTVRFSVKGNVASTQAVPGIVGSKTTFSLGQNSIVALGQTTAMSAKQQGSVIGGTLTIVASPTLAAGIDSSTAPSAQLVMGSTQNNLASFRFTETTNFEDVKITDLNIYDKVSPAGALPSFGNLTLYQGTAVVGTAGSATLSATDSSGSAYYYTFHFAVPVIVPRQGSIVLTLKGDVATYVSGGATDGSTHAFYLAGTSQNITALGSISNIVVNISILNPTGNTHTIVRTQPGPPSVGALTIDKTTYIIPLGTTILPQLTYISVGGVPASVTWLAAWTIDDPTVLKSLGGGAFQAIKVGTTAIHATYLGLTVNATVSVTGISVFMSQSTQTDTEQLANILSAARLLLGTLSQQIR